MRKLDHELDNIATYLNADETTPTVPTPDVLIGFTVLTEVHIQVVLHVLPATRTICENEYHRIVCIALITNYIGIELRPTES